jgi:hypothetical protein
MSLDTKAPLASVSAVAPIYPARLSQIGGERSADGQPVARAMRVNVLLNATLALRSNPGWGSEAPLWLYILKDAKLPPISRQPALSAEASPARPPGARPDVERGKGP